VFPLLVLLFIVVPIAELVVIIQVGQLIGVWWTVALLLADAVLGSMLARSQGRAAWRRLNAALQEGRMPAREVLDGALVLFGGALLLTPGFLSDILGLILLLPPTRAIVRTVLVRRFAGQIASGAARGAGARMGNMFTFQSGGRPRAGGGRSGDGDVVDGEATEVPPRRPELP
jgi:UPF0716 protein FxsA